MRCIQTDAGGVQGSGPGAGEWAWRRGRGRGGRWRKVKGARPGRVGMLAGAGAVRGTLFRWGTSFRQTSQIPFYERRDAFGQTNRLYGLVIAGICEILDWVTNPRSVLHKNAGSL